MFLLFVLVVVFLIYFHFSRLEMYQLTKDIPGPPCYPIIGSAHLFFNKSCEGIFNQIQDLLQKFESPAKIWCGPVLALLIDDPDDLQVVFNSDDCLEKSYVYNFFGCAKGLFAAPAMVWKVHRKLLNNCFSFSIMQKYFPIMNDKAKVFAQVLEKEVHLGREFDVLEYTGRCTLDMTFATNFQLDIDAQRDEWGRKYLIALEKLAESISERVFSVFHHPSFIYKFTFWGKQEHESRLVFNQAARLVIQNSHSLQKSSKNVSEPMPFITKLMLLKDCSPKIFTSDAVKDEIDTLVVGGNETTGLTLAFTILMLAMHPDIQEGVYQEICSNNAQEDPSYDTLTRLTYMEMVIKETLRHFAVGPVIGRRATANVKLNKYTIPKGAQLVICSYSIHRNPKFWGPDVLKFDPDRFSSKNSKNRHPFCYIPFSGGPRNCIGIKYAWISMKLVLWHLLKKYRIHTSLKWEELKLMISVTLKLVNRHLISVELR